MALAVGSVTTSFKSSGSGSGNATLVLPSGMSVGDLLLFCIIGSPQSNFTKPPGFALAGYHEYTQFGSGYGWEYIYYKIVDGTETNYTWNVDSGYLSFIHVTGWNGTVVNPILYSRNNDTIGSSPMPRTASGLLIMQGSETDETGVPSSPTITSAAANPTWTQIYAYNSLGVNDESGFSFYAASSDSDEITDFNITNPGRNFALYYLASPQDAAGNNDFLAVDPTFFSQSAAVVSNFSNEFLAVDPVFFTQNANVGNTVSVENLEKPNASDVENLPK